MKSGHAINDSPTDGNELRNGRRERERVWPAALCAALVAHCALALFSPRGVTALTLPPRAEELLHVDVLDLDEELPLRNPGGGSPHAGAESEAKPVAAVEPPPVRKVAAKTPKQPTRSEAPVHPKLEPAAVPQEVNEPDALLADAFDEPAAFALTKPKAARTALARTSDSEVQPRAVARDNKEKRPSDPGTLHRGSGPGRRGGPGGPGQGNGRVVKEKFAFGGPEGAFQADVCALPRGTASIGQVADCPHLLTFFADRINVAQRHFREGFPGIEDRVEWFGIKYTGQFKAKTAGVYEFRLSSDDGSRLIIDDQLVINNDGTHAPLSRTGRIHLTEGAHQLKLLYFQGPGTLLALQLFVTPPGRKEKTFRPEF